jgi:hypothetical protein
LSWAFSGDLADIGRRHDDHDLIYFNEVDKGGHFASSEQREVFSAELRAAFRSLR